MENDVYAKRKDQALAIDTLASVLTYQEILEVCLAVGCHEDTVKRYRKEVKKIATAAKLIEEMKKKAGDRVAA